MLWRLIVRNIFRQKLRNALTALGIVIAVVAFGVLRTVVDAWYSGVDAASASRLITRHAVSLVLGLPISYQNKIRQVDGVTGVSHASWFAGVYIDEKNFFPQFAVEPETYFRLFPEIRAKPDESAAFIRDRNGAMVGRKLAERYAWKIGDVVPLRGTIYPGTWSFVIRAIYWGASDNVDQSTLFFHWDKLNETLKQWHDPQVDHVGIFFAGIDRPGRAAEISAAIDRLFANSLAETLTETEKAFQLGFVAMTEAIVVAIRIVSLMVIAIIMAVMANTMAMTARERAREYATLKALGFGPGFLVALIAGESLLIAVAAGAAGVLATFPAVDLIANKLGPLFPVFRLTPETMALGLASALAVGSVAAILPAWKAVSMPVGDGLGSIG